MCCSCHVHVDSIFVVTCFGGHAFRYRPRYWSSWLTFSLFARFVQTDIAISMCTRFHALLLCGRDQFLGAEYLRASYSISVPKNFWLLVKPENSLPCFTRARHLILSCGRLLIHSCCFNMDREWSMRCGMLVRAVDLAACCTLCYRIPILGISGNPYVKLDWSRIKFYIRCRIKRAAVV